MDASISGLINSQQGSFTEMLGAQQTMQQNASMYSMQSTAQKTEFDAIQSGISRLSSVGEAMTNLTNQQSQQIAQ